MCVAPLLVLAQAEAAEHVANMPNLHYLQISSSRLHELQLQVQWHKLKRLSLFGCGNLSSIQLSVPASRSFPQLEKLCLSSCSSWQGCPVPLATCASLST
jgi:hypothetical protein